VRAAAGFTILLQIRNHFAYLEATKAERRGPGSAGGDAGSPCSWPCSWRWAWSGSCAECKQVRHHAV